ncbi:hypothetical protein MYCTH_2312835 [Thermothelomyces thermophilus ATCC 42464]|uniref:Uncharacterized protein n=1 Tax=Thermothelomyces thermophilus (strain ATCC 42464 / BCRC 31852 / DSM 1799) TaxID=573729 RepID=G2QNB0_THET4|nr:uncharacterized protein MYCTH_2312835 [Thermothelomyces thermophilus ATCC 42464]AEO61983.1 hypothetical protein MYCTH_2312835 [Thermothelomyces thermophilus ATCC 42464]
MRSIWACSSCAALPLVALLGWDASASHVGREWNDVHRIPKARVTAHPVRRDEGTCPAEHTSCAASLGGDCCPSRYACAVDSCYATTAGPTTACGREGYYACFPVNGQPGCCPLNFVCGDGENDEACLPPAGFTYTENPCPTDYYLCPASANYGCCRSGLACGPNAYCYPTDPVTTTVFETITTTSGADTVTRTRAVETVVTPTIPTELDDDTYDAVKFVPTSVPKVPASSPSSESDGGLSGGAIGGIIAGVVVLLIVVVVAAFLIIRRLKRVEDIMERSNRGSSSGRRTRPHNQAEAEHWGRHLHSEVDEMSVNPLMAPTSATPNNTSISGTPTPAGGPAAGHGRSDSAGFHTPSPNMFPNFPDDRSRHASPDPNAGYFGPATASALQQQPMQPARIRGNTESSVGSAAPHSGSGYAYTHWRQQSNASELSADGSENGVGSPLLPGGAGGATAAAAASPPPGQAFFPELDGTATRAELPSGGIAGGPGPGPVIVSSETGTGTGTSGLRSRSGSAASARGHVRRRSDGGDGRRPGSGLEPLDETAEMHGHYGRRDQQAGQTAAGLNARWDDAGGYHHHPEAPGRRGP